MVKVTIGPTHRPKVKASEYFSALKPGRYYATDTAIARAYGQGVRE